ADRTRETARDRVIASPWRGARGQVSLIAPPIVRVVASLIALPIALPMAPPIALPMTPLIASRRS
ncbi:MAG TPA: hypothetical protein VGG24_07975, partial [Paraburkholderia sp.]